MSIAKGRNKQTHKQKTSNPNKHTDARSLWWYEHNRVRRGKTFLLTALAGRGSYLPSTSACLQECEGVCVCACWQRLYGKNTMHLHLAESVLCVDRLVCLPRARPSVCVCALLGLSQQTHIADHLPSRLAQMLLGTAGHTHAVLLKFNLLCRQRCSEYMRYFWIRLLTDI